MIVVVSLNTAIDRIMVVPRFRAGEVFRAEESQAFAGGKGLNVARVVRQLGVPVRVVGFLGGMPAPFIVAACTHMGVEARWVRIRGESRTCTVVVDPDGGQTVLNEPGPSIAGGEVDELREAVRAATSPGDLLCISGSAPPGVDDDVYAAIVAERQSSGVRVLVDVSGAALRQAAGAQPWALKPNFGEAEAAFGPGDAPALARRIAAEAEHALLTLGGEGVVYASGAAVTMFGPPPVETVNAVGSGDALAAGFLVGIESGLDAEAAVRLGVACGAANAMRLAPGIGSRAEVDALLPRVRRLGNAGWAPDTPARRPPSGSS